MSDKNFKWICFSPYKRLLKPAKCRGSAMCKFHIDYLQQWQIVEFSKIIQTALSTRTVTSASNGSGQANGGSVFSRLRGAKKNNGGRSGATNIQNRLGKKVGGGVQKAKSNKRTSLNSTQPKQQRKSDDGRDTKRPIGKNQKSPKKQNTTKKPNKKLTAEDLDKVLDSYMMKDPKTAQAKLDAELAAYMDDAPDILMDESL
ncbi:MAG: hypothetical protein EXX96DRAFT_537588 [Benjaminiella poitrasii]|nr:MAG: hypothetical protein EXX96DRAFT_537588 [Benjaminiella poitrasii]